MTPFKVYPVEKPLKFDEFFRLGEWMKATPEAHTGLASNEPRIEAACDGGIGGPFDDRASVGKQRHLVGLSPEFQHKVVVPHDAVGLQPLLHFGEINGPGALVNLN